MLLSVRLDKKPPKDPKEGLHFECCCSMSTLDATDFDMSMLGSPTSRRGKSTHIRLL